MAHLIHADRALIHMVFKDTRLKFMMPLFRRTAMSTVHSIILRNVLIGLNSG